MITRKQIDLFKCLIDCTQEKGHNPTEKELASKLNIDSKDVTSYIDSLEQLGCIAKQYSIARPIVVTEKGKELIKLMG